MGYGRTVETFQELPTQGSAATQLAPIEQIPTWFVTGMLTRGLSIDNPYGTSIANVNTPESKAQNGVDTITDAVSTGIHSQTKLRLPRRGRLLVAGAALATLPFAAVTTGCAAAVNPGTITGIIVEGTATPNDFVQAFNAAANVCPKIITEKDLAADAYKETT